MEFIKSNIWEIKRSGSLKFLGGALALFHALQFYLWSRDNNLPLKYAAEAVPLCRSLFENCEWVRVLPLGAFEAIYYAYAAVAILAALVFLLSSFVTFGFWLLVICWWIGGLLYIQDLRISANETFMILFLTLSFLVIPSKSRYFRWIVVSFFAAAGFAKLSPDWLSGLWFVEHMSLPIKLGEWLGAVTLLVEMIASACLLFKDARFFLTGWISLLVLQAMMLYIGEVFLPVINIFLLVFLALQESERRKAEREYIYQSFIRPEPSFIMGGLFLIVFWIAQILPFFGVTTRTTVAGLFDLWALQPMASHEECTQMTFALYKNRVEQVSADLDSSRSPTLRCNLYLRFLDLKSMCRSLKERDSDFVTLSSILEVRSLRTRETRRAFEVKDFCQADLNFKKLSGVRWNLEEDVN